MQPRGRRLRAARALTPMGGVRGTSEPHPSLRRKVSLIVALSVRPDLVISKFGALTRSKLFSSRRAPDPELPELQLNPVTGCDGVELDNGPRVGLVSSNLRVSLRRRLYRLSPWPKHVCGDQDH